MKRTSRPCPKGLPPPKGLRIFSGGQTGVDRAALDAALALGIPHGGFCPRGRRAEDGPIPGRYRLREMETPGYAARTRRNIALADATLVLSLGALTRGSALTLRTARLLNKPHLAVRLDDPGAMEAARDWLARQGPVIINVAGSSESKRPGIHTAALRFLLDLFRSA